MNPRPPHSNSTGTKTLPPQMNPAQGKNYDNISFKLIASKLFDLKINVHTRLNTKPNTTIKTLAWDLTDVFMSPLSKWNEIIEALQASKAEEFPVTTPTIDELSPSTASITLGKYIHQVSILQVRSSN